MAKSHQEDHERVIAKHGKRFCAAPFTSMHTLPNGDVTTCCKTRIPIGNLKTNTPEEIMNSEHAQSVRKEFLEGGMPSQCKNCWDYEASNSKAANNRVFSNHAAHLAVDEAVASTDPATGSMSKHHPAWLDLLWTNKCNFACNGCTPELSDTIKRKYKSTFATIQGIPESEYHPELSDDDHTDNETIIKYVLDNADSLSMIHLNGGEPFMQEDTYLLLQELIDRDLTQQVYIWSHTNGSINKYKGKDIVDTYLRHWGDNCKITMSVDGDGARGEYIRWGWRADKWKRTYTKIHNAGIDVSIQTCWNALNALHIADHGAWLNQLPKKQLRDGAEVSGSLTVWQGHSAFDPKVFQCVPEYVERAVDTLERARASGDHPGQWALHFDGHINYIRNPLPEDRLIKCVANFHNGIAALDADRGTDFDTVFPELVDFRAKSLEWLNERR